MPQRSTRPDGSIVIVTNKKDQSVSLVDAKTLVELARVKTTKKIVHGVAVVDHPADLAEAQDHGDQGRADQAELDSGAAGLVAAQFAQEGLHG